MQACWTLFCYIHTQKTYNRKNKQKIFTFFGSATSQRDKLHFPSFGLSATTTALKNISKMSESHDIQNFPSSISCCQDEIKTKRVFPCTWVEKKSIKEKSLKMNQKHKKKLLENFFDVVDLLIFARINWDFMLNLRFKLNFHLIMQQNAQK